MHVYDILRRPLVTEKTTRQQNEDNQYSFVVDKRSNKMLVKDAVETAFNVTVLNVRIVNIPPKMGRAGRAVVIKKPTFKKAIVTLKPGDTIQVFEGV